MTSMQTSIATDNNLEKSRLKLDEAGDAEVHIRLPHGADNANVSIANARSPPGLHGSAAPADNLNGTE